jgi:transposase-like protein
MTIVPIKKLILQVPDGDERKYVADLCWQLQGQIRMMVERSMDELLKEQVDQLLERASHVRRKRSKKGKVKERCSRCLSHERQKFRRNGHYQRRLKTQWGKLQLDIPQVKCACGGNVKLCFREFRPGQRIWDDFSVKVCAAYGLGLSYRQIKLEWDEIFGSSVGLGTLNQRVLAASPQKSLLRVLKEDEVPPVVRLDGIWFTVMFQTQETKVDCSGRKRAVKLAKKVPILAAQGVWPETGKSVLLAWMLAEGEDHNSWQAFLERLYHMGITVENGLRLLVADGSEGFRSAYESRYWMVPFQRCVFHKLRNIIRAIRTPAGLDRQAAKEYRTPIIHQAAQIWRAEDEKTARLRYQAFCTHWHSLQPKAVDTLKRDFDQTLAFYAVQKQAAALGQFWPAYTLRTTSPLERLFREFRRRYRNAVLFHSPAGAIAATAQLAHRFS